MVTSTRNTQTVCGKFKMCPVMASSISQRVCKPRYFPSITEWLQPPKCFLPRTPWTATRRTSLHSNTPRCLRRAISLPRSLSHRWSTHRMGMETSITRCSEAQAPVHKIYQPASALICRLRGLKSTHLVQKWIAVKILTDSFTSVRKKRISKIVRLRQLTTNRPEPDPVAVDLRNGHAGPNRSDR